MPENINTPVLTGEELIHWLEQCASEEDAACTECPYGNIPGVDSCGKLLLDAAAALKAKQEAEQ